MGQKKSKEVGVGGEEVEEDEKQASKIKEKEENGCKKPGYGRRMRLRQG